MRFIVDNMLPRSLAEFLVDQGHEAHTVARLKLGSDASVWQRAEDIEAVVITKDSDFADLAAQSSRARLVLIRGGNLTTAGLLHCFRLRLPEILLAIKSGEKIIEVR